MADFVIFFLVLVSAGFTAGFLAGLFGIGGGLVFVPVLFFMFSALGVEQTVAMSLAVSTSLATIIFSAISSSFAHYQLDNVDINTLKIWILPILLGDIVAAQWVKPEYGKLILFVFVGLLLLVAYKLLSKNQGKNDTNMTATQTAETRVSGVIYYLQHIVLAFCISAFAVLAGVGGGALSVPALIFLGLTTHKAIGTSAVIGICITLPSVLIIALTSETPETAPALTYGQINYFALGVLACCSVLAAPFGARLGKQLDALLLKRLFACCLFVVAIAMLLKFYFF